MAFPHLQDGIMISENLPTEDLGHRGKKHVTLQDLYIQS